ncbi:MAG: hypothetical protein JWN04_904 [Myxococcaceae bacterium]|nr:hypothetical protein [Myxococcaceae bacterium]
MRLQTRRRCTVFRAASTNYEGPFTPPLVARGGAQVTHERMQLVSGAHRGFFVEARWMILVVASALVACGRGREQSPAVAVAHDVHSEQKSVAVQMPVVARAQDDAGPSPASAPAVDASQARSPLTSRERLEVFWLAFRTAVAWGDKEAIADLARFPFETRGSDDSNPVREHDRAALIAMLDKLLEQDSVSSSAAMNAPIPGARMMGRWPGTTSSAMRSNSGVSGSEAS